MKRQCQHGIICLHMPYIGAEKMDQADLLKNERNEKNSIRTPGRADLFLFNKQPFCSGNNRTYILLGYHPPPGKPRQGVVSPYA